MNLRLGTDQVPQNAHHRVSYQREVDDNNQMNEIICSVDVIEPLSQQAQC